MPITTLIVQHGTKHQGINSDILLSYGRTSRGIKAIRSAHPSPWLRLAFKLAYNVQLLAIVVRTTGCKGLTFLKGSPDQHPLSKQLTSLAQTSLSKKSPTLTTHSNIGINLTLGVTTPDSFIAIDALPLYHSVGGL
jgi:hypothetical protein